MQGFLSEARAALVRWNTTEPIRLRMYITAILATVALVFGFVIDAGSVDTIVSGIFGLGALAGIIFGTENGRAQVTPNTNLPAVAVTTEGVGSGTAVVSLEAGTSDVAVIATPVSVPSVGHGVADPMHTENNSPDPNEPVQ